MLAGNRNQKNVRLTFVNPRQYPNGRFLPIWKNSAGLGSYVVYFLDLIQTGRQSGIIADMLWLKETIS